MLEDNIRKISNIIIKYYEEYGELINYWAIQTDFSSINSLAKHFASEYTNATEILKQLQSNIKDLIDEIYSDTEQTPGKIYDAIIKQIKWKIPQNKKNAPFFQFLKNHRPLREYRWTEIENEFRCILGQNIEDSESTLINNINDLDWEAGEILDDLESTLSKDLVDLINANNHDYMEGRKKIYASDIANIVETYDKLNVYKTIEQMIDNKRLPDWITSFWNGSGIDLERGYNSDSFQKIDINNNCIIDVFENKCIKTITSYFKTNIDYNDYSIWVNLSAEDELIPADLTKINVNDDGLEWDIIFDNILYFVNSQKSSTDIMTRFLQNEAKKYLKTLLFILHNENVHELEIRRNNIGYYCDSLLNYYIQKIKRTDTPAHWTIDDYRYYRQKEQITPLISSLLKYIHFPTKERYIKFSKERNNLNLRLSDEIISSEIETIFLENHKNYSLMNIDISKKKSIKDNYDIFKWNDDNDTYDINTSLLFDISKCLLDKYSENAKAEICNYFIFGNKRNKIIDKANNSILKKKNITPEEKLIILFMNLCQYPTTIKSVFKYDTLNDEDYKEVISTGEVGIESFIEDAYKIIGKDRKGKPIRKIIDDYKLNGRFYNQTKAFLKLPKMILLNEESLDILGNGCSEILDNCENLINYALAMQYNPLFSKDKKEERIFELICCYPKVYKDFIS